MTEFFYSGLYTLHSTLPPFSFWTSESPERILSGLSNKFRQRPTLPHRRQCSTISAEGLNFRVRNGVGCIPLAIVAGNSITEDEEKGLSSFLVMTEPAKGK